MTPLEKKAFETAISLLKEAAKEIENFSYGQSARFYNDNTGTNHAKYLANAKQHTKKYTDFIEKHEIFKPKVT